MGKAAKRKIAPRKAKPTGQPWEGRKFRVCEVGIIARVEILTDDGALAEPATITQPLTIVETGFKQTIAEILSNAGLGKRE